MRYGPAICLALTLAAALPATAAEYRRPTAAQMQEIRRWLCPNGGMPVRGAPGRCDGAGRGSTRSASGFGSPAPGWDHGLPAASRVQSSCPEGTRPTLARGHEDILRCLPG
ncbi:hypothetical protein [Roseomonas marmotae]|uniref:Uncharacterized protein n=1 Tax=Roseomonas marmotae TaxID=2768161 RepID=A0ABS3KD61_9PROT|nr:hypothetical protein [Roseomonas marmotae]MBO1075409.1 hypothetical protein [Roseomonas marmotae]QTI78396.1 hypothetical protein IAI58_11925 [Roseomonas marmotae]